MAFLPRSLRDRPTPGPSPEASWLSRLGLALGIGVGAVAVGLGPAAAQAPSTLAACEPPGDREYLLLVVVGTDEAQNRLTQTLPPSVKAPTCDYLGSRVARMGGFKTPEDADAWASYLREVASLAAFVAKPSQPGAIAQTPVAPPAVPASAPVSASPSSIDPNPIDPNPIDLTTLPPANNNPPAIASSSAIQDPAQTAIAAPATVPVAAPIAAPITSVSTAPAIAPTISPASTPTYRPTSLQPGYAVLVDYGNQTSLVAIVAQLTQRPVGLVSYGQRPYLLVAQTPDSGPALATLKTLSQNGFRTLLVESAQATLLTPAIQLP